MNTINGYKFSKCYKMGDFYVSNDNCIYSAYDGKLNGVYFLSDGNKIGVIRDYSIRIDKGDLYREVDKKVGLFKTVRRFVSLRGYELPGEYYQSVREFKPGLFWCNYGELGVKEYQV